MKRLTTAIIILCSLMLLVSCADQEPTQCLNPAAHVYGFFGGLWHGLIIPFNFIGSLFWDDVAIYAPSNNGVWYALGFTIGAGGLGKAYKMVGLAIEELGKMGEDDIDARQEREDKEKELEELREIVSKIKEKEGR
jgi:hypothetical protein